MSQLKLVLSASSSQSLEEERDFKEHGARLIDLNNFSLTLARPHVCEEREIRNLIIYMSHSCSCTVWLCLLYLWLLYLFLHCLLLYCSWLIMYSDFLQGTVSHMKKPVGGCSCLSDEQIKKIQRYHGLAIAKNILPTPNPSDREVNVAYTMKKNIVTILHHSV